ncbi:hypothetical protein ES703_62223 [subsurface metagenome]
MLPRSLDEAMRKKFNLNREELARLYLEEKMTTYQIAERVNITPPQIRYWLKKYSIKTRGTSEANRLAFLKGRRVDTNRRGSESPNWKGGRFEDRNGYIHVYAPGHPRAVDKYVLEHILVWEQANNRELPKGYIIHHLNGLRDDNHPENLVGLSTKDHDKVDRLKLAEARIRQLERELASKQEPWERN